MSQVTAEHVRSLIVAACAPQLASFGIDAEAVGEEYDLRASGLVDSLGFIEIVTELEDALGIEIDLEALPPEDLTRVGPLSRHVAAQAAGVPARP